MKLLLGLIPIFIVKVSSTADAGPFDEDPGFGESDWLPEAEWDSRDNDTLRLVQVLYRHGDRSPIHNYTNDIYKESDWPQGYGQLSTEGMRQEFNLGSFLQEEYVNTGFLNPEYSRAELYVRSTSFDRALMSAYSVLSSLFPVLEEESRWNPAFNWQPIPVHTVPLDEDCLLLMNCRCPIYDAAKEKDNENNPNIQQTMVDYSEFFNYASMHSGEPNTYVGIGNVLDPLFCQNASGYILPDWVNEDVMDQIVQLRDIYSAVSSSPTAFSYLKGGALVREMLDHMINKSKNDESTMEKLFMYSAHDSTVIQFLTTLGIFNDRQPPYTACVIVELHESQTGEFSVRIGYKNESERVPYSLPLPDCTEFCPLDTFAQIMKPSLPEDIKKACGVTSISEIDSGTEIGSNSSVKSVDDYHAAIPDTSTIVIIVLLCLIVLMVIIVAIMCCVMRNRIANTHDYMPVPLEMS